MGRAPTDFCSRFHQNKRSDGDIVDACGACQMLCEADAINFEQQDEILEPDVGTIIVATGFEMWDPVQLSQYSYGESSTNSGDARAIRPCNFAWSSVNAETSGFSTTIINGVTPIRQAW